MPEGDTLARISAVLGKALSTDKVIAARGRPGGARLDLVVGHRVASVEARGKHLLIGFSNGLTLHTHLQMNGEWHRYRPGERWHRSPSRAVAVIETERQVAVCFDAPTVELLETRALAAHPRLSRLGPNLAREGFDVEAAMAALRDPSRAASSIGDALLDQRAVAGFGNVYRSELCFLEQLNPFTSLAEVPDSALRRLLSRGAMLVRANSAGGSRVTTEPGSPAPLYVYGRTGRPCRRCGAIIKSSVVHRDTPGGGATPRRVYWCPRCQGPQKAD